MFFERQIAGATVAGAPTPSLARAAERAAYPMPPFKRLQILGAAVDPVTPAQVLDFIDRRIKHGRKAIIANHNLHSLYLTAQSPEMQVFFQRADIVQIDSTPMIAWGRLLGQAVSRAHRSTYLDWRDDFWALAAERRWRVFLLGAAPGVADRMAKVMQARWPTVQIAAHHGYFDPQPGGPANVAVVEAINAFRPDVVMVAMGMPVQETWISQNVDAIRSGVFLSVGGAFDYEAGVQVAAPRWLGRLGLEWMFRFALSPRRLFGRYFIEPWSLLSAAWRDVAIALGRRHG